MKRCAFSGWNRRLSQRTSAAIFWSCRLSTFSEMHLPELPVYQALAMKLLGMDARSDQALRMALKAWTEAQARSDAGVFKTTPFFISYIDPPQWARPAHFQYLKGMAKVALGDRVNALNDFRQSVECDPSRLYPWIECKACFA